LPWAVGGWSIETTKGMAAMTKEMTRQAIMMGYIDAFYFFVATVLLSVPLIIFVRWNKPKS